MKVLRNKKCPQHFAVITKGSDDKIITIPHLLKKRFLTMSVKLSHPTDALTKHTHADPLSCYAVHRDSYYRYIILALPMQFVFSSLVNHSLPGGCQLPKGTKSSYTKGTSDDANLTLLRVRRKGEGHVWRRIVAKGKSAQNKQRFGR